MVSLPAPPLSFQFNSDPAPQQKVNAAQLDTQLVDIFNWASQLTTILGQVLRADNQITDQTIRLFCLHPEILSVIGSQNGAVGYGWQPLVAAQLATTGANLVLTGEQTIDGVLTSVSRVLVKDQTLPSQNGLYTTGPGAWVRTADATTGAQLGYGIMAITQGLTNAGAVYICNVPSTTLVVGTTNIMFVKMFNPSGVGQILSGGTGATSPGAWPTSRRLMARAVAVVNVATAAPGATIDGAALAIGDRVLLTAQVTTAQNGLWVWQGPAVSMTRPLDFPSGGTLQAFQDLEIPIREGSAFAGAIVRLTTAGAITIDTTGTSWVTVILQPVQTIALLKGISGSFLPSGITVQVLGFSAIGDGGAGTFRWNSADARADDTGTIIQPTVGGVGRWNRQYDGAANVRWFGAKGDAITDDRPPFVAALATGKAVYVPGTAASYLLSAGLPSLLSGQRLFGDGIASKITCATANSITVVMTAVTDCIVENIFAVNTGTNSSGSTGQAITMNTGCSRCTVRGCRVEGNQGGVLVENSNDCLITGNDGTYSNPAQQDSYDFCCRYSSSRNVLSHNRCLGGGNHGILIQTINAGDHCDDNVISNNTVTAHGTYGIIIYRNAAGSTCERNIVSGNIVKDITGAWDDGSHVLQYGAGIYLQGAEYTQVIGNSIKNTNINTGAEQLAPAGIGVANLSCATITGNSIELCNWFGIYLNDSNGLGNGKGSILLANNEITQCVKDGIKIVQQNRVRVTGNDISFCRSGFQSGNISTKAGLAIIGNTFSDNNQIGITINFNDDVKISDNLVKNSTVNGIVCSNANKLDVAGNEVIGTGAGGAALQVNGTCTQTLVRHNILVGNPYNFIDNLGCLMIGNRINGGTTADFAGIGGPERQLAASATPSVADADLVYTQGATGITNLTGGVVGQRVTLRATGAITITSGSGILLSGAANFTMATGNTLTLVYSAALAGWIELSRKV